MKKYSWTFMFFAALALGLVSCQWGCSTAESAAGKALLKESAFAAAVLGLDAVADDVKEVAAVKDALTMDIVGAFSASDDAAEIARDLKQRATLTALSEVSRRLLLNGLRTSLTGEGAGQTGVNASKPQMDFNEALAAAL